MLQNVEASLRLI